MASNNKPLLWLWCICAYFKMDLPELPNVYLFKLMIERAGHNKLPLTWRSLWSRGMHSVVPLHYKTPCYVLLFWSKFSVLEEVHKVLEENGHLTTPVFYLSKFKSSFVLLEFLFDIEEGGGGLQSSSLRCKCLDQVEKMQVAQSAARRVHRQELCVLPAGKVAVLTHHRRALHSDDSF